MSLPSEARLRFDVVDALRGFCIVSIMLLHNIEHFDYIHRPDGLPAWMVTLDKGIWDTLFFLFGGKVYGIFALLFGLTFFIQSNNYEKRGGDFRGRFAWRLVLLFGFGCFNSIFYQGDILSLYAVIGFLMIPFARMSNRWVWVAVVVLMLQPFGLYKAAIAILNPEIPWKAPVSWSYFGQRSEYMENGSFWDVAIGNLTIGKTAVVLWSWEKGRYFQMLALFLIGMLLGRQKRFADTSENTRFWLKVSIGAAVSFVLLYTTQRVLGPKISVRTIQWELTSVWETWVNLAFMGILVSTFVLLFRLKATQVVLKQLIPIGKMSLSNYIIQSCLGAVIYYGFGLGLWKHTGSTHCILIGTGLAIGMWVFCKFWTSRFRHGPFEYLWHRATWVNSDK